MREESIKALTKHGEWVDFDNTMRAEQFIALEIKETMTFAELKERYPELLTDKNISSRHFKGAN